MKMTKVITHDRCMCCAKKKKDVKPYYDEFVNGDFCGKCYEKLVIVEKAKIEIGLMYGDKPGARIINDIISLTVEKIGWL